MRKFAIVIAVLGLLGIFAVCADAAKAPARKGSAAVKAFRPFAAPVAARNVAQLRGSTVVPAPTNRRFHRGFGRGFGLGGGILPQLLFSGLLGGGLNQGFGYGGFQQQPVIIQQAPAFIGGGVGYGGAAMSFGFQEQFAAPCVGASFAPAIVNPCANSFGAGFGLRAPIIGGGCGAGLGIHRGFRRF